MTIIMEVETKNNNITSPIAITKANIEAYIIDKTIHRYSNYYNKATFNSDGTFNYENDQGETDSGNYAVTEDTINVKNGEKVFHVVYISDDKIGFKDVDNDNIEWWYFTQEDAQNNKDN